MVLLAVQKPKSRRETLNKLSSLIMYTHLQAQLTSDVSTGMISHGESHIPIYDVCIGVVVRISILFVYQILDQWTESD